MRYGPLTLDFPLAAVAEGDERAAKRKGINVLLACGVVPGAWMDRFELSDNSSPLTFAMAARPCECRPDVSPGSQLASPSRSKKKANSTGTPLQVP